MVIFFHLPFLCVGDMGLFVQFQHQLGGAEFSPMCEQHPEHTSTEESP